MTILRVRKQIFNGYIRYKYTDKYDWTNKDIDSVEDPIEFVYENKKSLINQREVSSHTKSFANALKGVIQINCKPFLAAV